MKVDELIGILEKCKPDDEVVCDVDGGMFSLTFVWEEEELGVILCVDELPGEECEENECGEMTCNKHSSVAEI